MKKFLLTTGVFFAGILALQAESRDFKYPQEGNGGIMYTIIDDVNHLVKTKGGEIQYKDNNQTISQIVYGNTVDGSLNIPEKVEYNNQVYTVVGIGEYGFSDGLTSITLPSTITDINVGAFYKTKISSIEIPEAVKNISAHAFQDCSRLDSVVLPEGLISIDAFAFYNCSQLSSITFPATLDAIGAAAFTNCSALKSITSLNVNPPALTANSFSVSSATVNVPNQSLSAYQNSSWKKLGSINPIPVPATSVTLDRNAMIVYVGGTHMPLHATAYPSSTTDVISWESSNENIVKIEEGLVVGKSEGEAVITATCGEYSATCTVTVRSMSANSVTVNSPQYNIYVGDEFTFTATVYPENLQGTISWSTSNDNVATINPETGLLKAISPGVIVVYAQCDDKKGAREITIHAVPATSIAMNKTYLELQTNGTSQLSGTVYPSNATDQTLVWKSSNEAVASVDNSGFVTANGIGKATITVSCGYLAYNTCEVEVIPTPANEVILSDSNVSLKASQDQKLDFTVLPETTTDKTVVWTSLNPEIAEVSTDGIIKAKTSGVARIQAKCGDAVSVCTVSVEEILPEEIIINMAQVSLRHTESIQLSANRKVNWKSENEKIATVSTDGLVVAKGIGKTTIIANDGKVSSNCIVTVLEIPAEQVVLNEIKATANVGVPYSLVASVFPLNTTNKEITWISNAPEIAKVEGGIITGVAPGNVIIKAVCGNASALCNVTVLSPAQGISLDSSILDLHVGEIKGLVAKIEPFDSTDTLIEWNSSNPEIAEVNSHGIVQAISRGNTVITANCGSQKAECYVNVINDEMTVGVEAISPDADGLYNVYSTNGVLLLNKADYQQLHQLAPGIYVVNGKKAIIK